MREGAIQYLSASVARDHAHSGRRLLDHLLGTERLLADWDCVEDVRLAGLCHSVYGTNAFRNQVIDPSKRGDLAALIGKEAENLVYLFHVAHRPNAFLAATYDGLLADRFSGDLIDVSSEKAWGLLEIECANLIEQNSRSKFLGRFIELSEENAGTCRRQVLDAVRAYICSSKPS